MKLLIILFLTTLLTACGKDDEQANACAIPEVGTWLDQFSGQLTINSDCSFSESQCAAIGTFSPDGQNLNINITQTNSGPFCLSVGPHTCFKTVSDEHNLHLICDGNLRTYAR